jgi:hypothetical protein
MPHGKVPPGRQPQPLQASSTKIENLVPAPGLASVSDKGPPKKKSVTPAVGGGVSGQTGPGSDLFVGYFFYGVFELPSPRNAQKRD